MQKETVKPQKSAIEQNSIIQEIIKRDKKFHSINTVFTLNLKRLYMITEKPNSIDKDRLDLELRAKHIPPHIDEKIKYYFKVPSERYENPMTSSQDVGWYPTGKLNIGMKRHPKLGCDVTKYADDYYAMKGRSPYATREAPVEKVNKK